jgi:membrane-associated phospholipid phosphatase
LKVRHGFRGFLARRLSREEYLGLHLSIGLLLSVLLVVLFGTLGRAVDHGGAITRLDLRIGERLRDHREAEPGWRGLFVAITEMGSATVLTTLGVGMALWLLLRHRQILALVWAVAQGGGALLNVLFKEWFARGRPLFHAAEINENSYSFPSGHAMGALVAYGLVAYYLVLTLRSRLARAVAVTVLALLVLAVGFSRVYLGAHWFSDVVGGFVVGAAWLAVCISAIESGRRRSLQRRAADRP